MCLKRLLQGTHNCCCVSSLCLCPGMYPLNNQLSLLEWPSAPGLHGCTCLCIPYRHAQDHTRWS
jgi:hypothetical protein